MTVTYSSKVFKIHLNFIFDLYRLKLIKIGSAFLTCKRNKPIFIIKDTLKYYKGLDYISRLTKPKEAIITAQTKHTPKPNINHPYDKQQKCENKIKILSDVRFDRGISYETPPAVLKSTATSSSVVPNTKRILINGTPGFTQKSDMKTCNYSQDEIMAMPTLIILPKSGNYMQKCSFLYKIGSKETEGSLNIPILSNI